jgi:hypothetical protein
MRHSIRTILGFALAGALAATATLAQAQQVYGRVISSSPIRDANGPAGYSVTYEYAGHQYTTRTDGPPGATIALQVSPMGVATSPMGNQPPMGEQGGPPPQNWDNVASQPGVVVGAGAPPAPVYGAPAYGPPGYAQPVYVQPPYGYGYGGYGYAPWGVVAPISLSLGFGYSHGWGGYHHWH